jgi:hypothetical protein
MILNEAISLGTFVVFTVVVFRLGRVFGREEVTPGLAPGGSDRSKRPPGGKRPDSGQRT